MRVVILFLVLGVCDASVLSSLFQLRGKLLGYPAWASSEKTPVKRDAAPYRAPKASCGAYNRENAVDCFHYLADRNCDHALDRVEVSKGLLASGQEAGGGHFNVLNVYVLGGLG